MVLAENLRQAVLQAALQGKLTKQLDTDSDVDEMLEYIQIDREMRIKSGNIKRDKRLTKTIIDEEEIPFIIPNNWRWTVLGGVVYKLTDGTHKTPKYTTNGVKFISVKNMSSGVLDLSETKYISQDEHDELYKRCNPERGDMLLSKIGTTGVPAIVNTDEKFSLFVSVALLKYSHQVINESFLYYLLLSPLVQEQAKENTRGVGNKNWVLDFIAKTIIPIPPIEEQQRIVDKINEIMPKIDEYEKIEKKLEALKKEFPTNMKNALLQAAMQGRLTEQLKSDSDVDELLLSIQKEKEELIVQKKIKKEKSLPDIEEEEIPFDIPDNWRWEKVGNICDCGAGATPTRGNKEFYDNGTIFWLKTGELTDGYIYQCEEKVTQLALEKCSLRLNKTGDVLIAMYGATIGKLGIVTFPLTTNQACCGCSPYKGINNIYLFYYFMSAKKMLIGKAEGGAQPNISREKIRNSLIPIPPIEEQQRIVERLEELLSLCEDLNGK